MTKCPRCGTEAESKFCPNCGANLQESQSEEPAVIVEESNDIPADEKTEKKKDKTSKTTNCKHCEATTSQQTADHKTKENLTAAEAARDPKEVDYLTAVKLLETKTVNNYKKAIDALKSLDGWKDSEELIKKAEEELPNLEHQEAEQKKIKVEKRKKILKKVAIIGGTILVLCIVLSIIVEANKFDVSACPKTKEYSLHNMSYAVPTNCKEVSSTNKDTQQLFSIKNEGEVVAVLEILYTGENDLSGDAESKTAEESSDSIGNNGELPNLLPDSIITGYCDEVTAKHSVFYVTLYYVDGKIKGEDELLTKVCDSFKTSEYVNCRESKGVTATYSGDTEEGTTIGDTSDIKVVEAFNNGLAEGTKKLKWKVKEPVTLVAGQTSTVTIVITNKEVPASGAEVTLQVTCSTMSPDQFKAACVNRDYKELLRNPSYDEYTKITGMVLQDCGSGLYRISSNGSWDDVYMVETDANIVEDDYVTVYGFTDGVYEYETVLGANQKVPYLVASYVDR